MPIYTISVTRRKQGDATVEDRTFVVAPTRVSAVTAFDASLTTQQRNRIESVLVEEVTQTYLTGV